MLASLGGLPPAIGDELRDTCEGRRRRTAAGRCSSSTCSRRPPTARSISFPPTLDAEAPLGLYGYQPDPAPSEYPLALISPASERTISSTLGELPRPDVWLEMQP